MPTSTEQNFKNHARYDPIFHFVAAPVLILTFVAAIIHAVHHFSKWNIWLCVVALLGILLAVRFRQYALMVQDRVIRLEERQRLALLCGAAMVARIPELTIPQLIALRFASDAELPGLAERALNEKLDGKQIKMAIQVWRPDFDRV
jgi:hypothetical protein